MTGKKVTIDTSDYVNTWGRKPAGDGNWAFNIGGDIHFVRGAYREAIANAKAYAAQVGVTEIAVLG